MMLRLISSIFCFLLWLSASAQVIFRAEVDDTDVRIGSFFTITYELQGFQGKRFQPPTFKDFKIVGGPSQSRKTTVRNGKVNQLASYEYQLKALSKGTFTIEPATIVVNGKQIKSNPVTIKVQDAMRKEDVLTAGAPDDEPFFMTASVQQDTVFVGQKLVLDYRIFTKTKINNVDINSPIDLPSFEYRAVALRNTPTDQVEIDGETYLTKLIARYVLFPKRAGNATIDPVQFQVLLPSKRRRGFFFDQYTPKFIMTNAIDVFVKALPSDAPDEFSGAIGSYSMETMPPRQRLTTDDAISIRMKIFGDGDPNRIAPKMLLASPGLERYEPKVLAANSAYNGLQHDAELEYIFTANSAGRYVVEPIFNYFDVDSQRYITLTTDSIWFQVGAGSGEGAPAGIDTAVVYQLTKDSVLAKPCHLLASSMPVRFGWIGLWLATLGLALWSWRKRLLEARPVKRTIAEEATLELEALAASDQAKKAHRVEEILSTFLRRKLKIAASEWKDESFKSAAHANKWSTDHVQKALDILNKCRLAAYAGFTSSQENSIIDETKILIQSIEATVK